MASRKRSKPLTEKQLRELLDGHLNSAAQDDWIPLFQGALQKVQDNFFVPGAIEAKSDDEMVELAVDLYKKIVSPAMFVRSLRNNPTRLRQGIQFLVKNREDMVACADAGPVVAVEVFVKERMIPPVGIVAKLLGTAEDRSLAGGIEEEDADQPPCDVAGHGIERNRLFMRAGRGDRETVVEGRSQFPQ